MKDLDFQLLKDLYCIFSPSDGEVEMRRFIKRYVTRNVPSARVEQDEIGNLLVTKGKADCYPCLCAHMDQVQNFHPKDFVCIDSGDIILGYSPSTRRQCGLGADDKNGIFVALTCLKESNILKCAFFVGEEIGCVGSNAVDTAFFNDCKFCVQIDRRGNKDIVTAISYDICSQQFIRDTNYESYGYAISTGLMTDVDELRRRGVLASCVNLSCGYYEPHTDYEFTVKADVQKCYDFVCHIIEVCTGDYTFVCERTSDNYRWGSYPYATNWAYDDCMDICCDMLSANQELTREEFIEAVKSDFPTLKKFELVEIYQAAKTYIS